jgi:hypothetical protein
MKLKWKPWKLWTAAGVVLVLSACDQGPLEKAGKAIDRAGEKTGDKIKDIIK